MNNNLSLSTSSNSQDISALKIESFNRITNKKEDKDLIQPITRRTYRIDELNNLPKATNTKNVNPNKRKNPANTNNAIMLAAYFVDTAPL